MADKDHDTFVEELLEASLKRHRSEAPRAGLENRIVANVRARDRALQPRRWVWALAASAAVLIVAVVVLRFTSRPAPRTASVPPLPQVVAPKADTPKVVAVAPPVTRVARRSAKRSERASAELHRPEQFPTPSPLTEQERLLLQYVRETPPSKLMQQVSLVGTQDLLVSELIILDLDLDVQLGTPKNGQTK